MPEPVRVMIQMRSTPSLAAASFGPVAAASPLAISAVAGVQFDATFSPVPIPPKPTSGAVGLAAAFSASEPPTYIVRAAVQSEALPDFLNSADTDPDVVGVFADPRIQPIAVCPAGPIGTDRDIEQLLLVEELRNRGMDGTGVKVVIVDTGVNMKYLGQHGKTPNFDAELSWGPIEKQPLGSMSVGHGTMCAYDVCIDVV